MQPPRTNGNGSPRTMLPAGVPSTSMASLMPRSSVPGQTFTAPGYRQCSPVTGNFSPGTSNTVPSATASSSSVYGTLEERTPMEPPNYEARGINSLPDKVLLKIFGYLTVQNKLGQIARMCKRWRELTRSPVLWKKVHVKLYGEKNCMVKGCQTEAARKFVSTLPSCVTYIWLDFMFVPGWAQPLYSQKFCAELRERFPQLEELFLKGATLTVTLPVFVELCSEFLQNVKKLTLRTVTFLGRHKESDFDGIHKIEALCLYACELKIYNDLEYLPMPLFKELDLTNTNVGDSWFSINPMFFQKLEVLRLGYLHIGSRAFHIIRNNTCYLKELYMCGTKLIDRDLNFDFPHLRTICLRCCASLTSAGIVSLIQSCQSLENVYVEEKMAKACEEHPYFLLNRCKLEIVKAYFCFDHYPKSFYD